MLKPGGRLLVVNETLKTLRDPIGVHAEAVAQFEGYEHAHWAGALPLGGRPRRFLHPDVEPCYHWFFRVPPPPHTATARAWRAGAPARAAVRAQSAAAPT